MSLITQADKQHFHQKLIEVVNYLGDMEEAYIKKYGKDSKYANTVERHRNNLNNYHGLNEQIIISLENRADNNYSKGYHNGVADAQPPPKRELILNQKPCYLKECKRAKILANLKRDKPELF